MHMHVISRREAGPVVGDPGRHPEDQVFKTFDYKELIVLVPMQAQRSLKLF